MKIVLNTQKLGYINNILLYSTNKVTYNSNNIVNINNTDIVQEIQHTKLK